MGNECSSEKGDIHQKRNARSANNKCPRAFIVECFNNDKEIINKPNVKEKLGDIIDALDYKEYEIGDYIFKEGDNGGILYFLAFGSIDIIAKKECNTIKKGRIFGTSSFFSNKARNSNAVCIQESGVYSIDLKLFNATTFTHISNPKQLIQYSIFSDLTDMERAAIFSRLVRLEFKPNQIIIQSGEPVKGLYIVTNGMVTDNDKTLSANQYFGDVEVCNNEKTYKSTIKATSALGVTTAILVPTEIMREQMPKVLTALISSLKSASPKLRKSLK